MAALDFNKALDVKGEDVKAVPVPPIGHYIWQVTGVVEITDGDVWQSVNFPCSAVSPYEDADDVDPDALKDFGKIQGYRNRKSFMFNKQDGTETDLINFQNQIKRFCGDHLGIEGADGMTLREMLSASKNKQFVGQLGHKPDKQDAETIRANIGRTAPVDA